MIKITKLESEDEGAAITDQEHELANALLTKVLDQWNISPIEFSVGPLDDGEKDSYDHNFTLSGDDVTRYENYYQVKLFKINMKTSIFLSVTGYQKKTQNGVDYDVIVGRGGRLKIKEPFIRQPLTDVEDYLKYDTYYIIAKQVSTRGYNLTLNIELSNEVVDIETMFRTIGIIGGVIMCLMILCCCCCICRDTGKGCSCLPCFDKCFGSKKSKKKKRYSRQGDINSSTHLNQNNQQYQSREEERYQKEPSFDDTMELGGDGKPIRNPGMGRDYEQPIRGNEYQLNPVNHQYPGYNYQNPQNVPYVPSNNPNQLQIRSAEWRRQQRLNR